MTSSTKPEVAVPKLTYCTFIRGGQSHDDHGQNVHKISRSLGNVFLQRADRQKDTLIAMNVELSGHRSH